MGESDETDPRDGRTRMHSAPPADLPEPRMSVTARLGALAGVAFFLFLMSALLIGSSTLTTPDVSGDVAVRDWAERHGQLKLRVAFLEVAAFFGLVFSVQLKVRIQRWGASREALLSFAGGLVLVTLLAAYGTASAAVLAADNLTGDPQVAKVFLLVDWSFGVGMSASLAAMVAGFSIAGYRQRTLPRWFTFVGLAVLAVFVLNAATWQTATMSILGLVWLPLAAPTLALKDTWSTPAVRDATG